MLKKILPQNVYLAYDNLKIEINTRYHEK